MASPPVGLDITPSRVTAVTLTKKGKAYTVQTTASAPMPDGVMRDGEVLDVGALAQVLRTLFAENKIKDKRVAVGIANQRCVVRVVDLPKLKSSKQLASTIENRVAEELPIPLEDAVWDFHTVGTYKDEETGIDRQRHVVVMVYRESVETLRDAVQQAGLKLARIDLAGFALMRSGLTAAQQLADADAAAYGVGGSDATAIALLDIGPTSTNVVVSVGGVCEMNRLIQVGTNDFSDIFVEQYGWTKEDAVRVVSEAGVQPPPGTDPAHDAYADYRPVLHYVADQFASELRTSFDYFHHNSGGSHRVSRVVIAGDGALYGGLADRLTAELGVAVTVLDAAPRLEPSSIATIGAFHPQLGTAMGLAMEEAA
jgi:type IV pilus assembly protein PilM